MTNYSSGGTVAWINIGMAKSRNLIPRLATSFHVVAPDYPGFGQSSMPSKPATTGGKWPCIAALKSLRDESHDCSAPRGTVLFVVFMRRGYTLASSSLIS
jgi:pimeloyl-ACP methyl ester carboxylesterase